MAAQKIVKSFKTIFLNVCNRKDLTRYLKNADVINMNHNNVHCNEM